MTNRNIGLSMLPNQMFYAFGLVLLISIFTSVAFQNIYILALPVIITVALLAAIDIHKIYGLFFLLLPFSIEISLPGALSTDLPAEPMMIGLSFLATLLFISKFPSLSSVPFRHPITLILLLHILWLTLATFFSENMFVSIKFLLAKLWYVIPFYFLAFYLLKQESTIHLILKALFFSLTLSIGFVMISHAGTSFSFNSINQAVSPLFRNHVNYACILVISFPYLLLKIKYASSNSRKYILSAIGIIFLAAIYLSYTRAAYVALVLMIIAYFVIRFKLMKIMLVSSTAVQIIALSFFLSNERYLSYMPDYEKAITHTKFDNLLEATTKMEDISTVERFYRWVAGYQMIKSKPVLGFGPGNFFFFYKQYTITGFKTYVSDNPDKSGIHNYYLMTSVEQGLVGGLIFIFLCFIVLLKGENVFSGLETGFQKDLVLAAVLSFVIICAILLINDMVEAAKVGPFFFLAMAIIVRNDSKKLSKIFPK